ncbi:hypothetical protein Drose_06945 [Dactylosporangium roseum]|uniref:Uncharacterized protein n=1 Tax=Dactylosporangium roseum TaxID=47989 RepID=A0ABY5Z7F9_9ACTN|nr:hypothetical protein [Dactylosporangium roseum]UWZ38001.1 hypothetical protein Drose_06945 [Dactylosporangium roseum]
MTGTDREEEIRFRDWLRTLDAQPSEVNGDNRWNHNVIADTWDYVTDPIPTGTAARVDTADDDTDGM